MLVNFTKMHGLGNDFIVIDAISQTIKLSAAQIKKLAHRQLGLGCDQVLIVEPPVKPDADFYYRIYNCDGQEVEQCGNGARCVARFVVDTGLINKAKVIADCLAGRLTLSIRNNNLINADFGCITATINKYTIDQPELPTEIYSLSLGNPHGICLVPELTAIPVAKWGQKLSLLACFPEQANITFMQIIDPAHIKLQTFERGANVTLACGSGACAAVIVGQHLDLLESTVTAAFTYGDLTITFDKHLSNLQMCGPAASVFIGRVRI